MSSTGKQNISPSSSLSSTDAIGGLSPTSRGGPNTVSGTSSSMNSFGLERRRSQSLDARPPSRTTPSSFHAEPTSSSLTRSSPFTSTNMTFSPPNTSFLFPMDSTKKSRDLVDSFKHSFNPPAKRDLFPPTVGESRSISDIDSTSGDMIFAMEEMDSSFDTSPRTVSVNSLQTSFSSTRATRDSPSTPFGKDSPSLAPMLNPHANESFRMQEFNLFDSPHAYSSVGEPNSLGSNDFGAPRPSFNQFQHGPSLLGNDSRPFAVGSPHSMSSTQAIGPSSNPPSGYLSQGSSPSNHSAVFSQFGPEHRVSASPVNLSDTLSSTFSGETPNSPNSANLLFSSGGGNVQQSHQLTLPSNSQTSSQNQFKPPSLRLNSSRNATSSSHSSPGTPSTREHSRADSSQLTSNNNPASHHFHSSTSSTHGDSPSTPRTPTQHPLGEHPSRTLFVRNISSSVDDEELKNLFETHGPIRKMYTNCKHRGFVMISYYDIRHAKAAMRSLQHRTVNRRNIDIHYSIPKDNPPEKDLNQGTLVVFNLDPSITNDTLMNIFSAYGEIKEIRETPNKKHHKFIEFFDVRHADAAMKELNKTELCGKRIKIEPSRPGGRPRSSSNSSHGTPNSPFSGGSSSSPIVSSKSLTPHSPNSNQTNLDHRHSYPQNVQDSKDDNHSTSSDKRENSSRDHHRNNDNPKRKPQNPDRFKIDLDRVKKGIDKRTTLMVKNIPNKYNQKMLLREIDEKFQGKYDFFYLPIDFQNKCNVGYAFINLVSPLIIIPFAEEFNRKKWGKFNSEKVCELTYGRIQGKRALVSHFEHSQLMVEDPNCRPAFFNPKNGSQ